VTRCWNAISEDQAAGDIAVIAHGGVLRSILSRINDTPLVDSFSLYSLHYGCVIRLLEVEGRWQYEVLWNQAPAEKEQHKPKAFYR
jgi:alpha-ribazole phosphatase